MTILSAQYMASVNVFFLKSIFIHYQETSYVYILGKYDENI